MFAQTRDLIEIPAIVEPHQGTSYNPPVDAHQELLEKAAELELKRLRDAEKMAEVKTKMEEAKLTQEDYDMSVAPGMKVQELHGDEVEQLEEGEEISASVKQVPERKTKAQRNRAARLLAEVSLKPSSTILFLTSLAETGSCGESSTETVNGVD